MKILVKVKPGARAAALKEIDPSHFEVAVKAPPVAGRANRAVIKALAEYFSVAATRVKIVSGRTSRRKVIEIL